MPNDKVHLATDNRGMQYFHGSGVSPITWNAPAVALNIYVSSFAGYDVPSMGCDPANGYVYLTATEGIEDSENTSHIIFTRSLDDGVTWEPPIRISSASSRGPSLAVGLDGTVYVTWVDYALGQALVARSTDHGASFLPPVAIANMLDNLAMRPIGWRQSQTELAVRGYPYYKSFNFAPNFPALAVDRSSGPTRGNLYATWAEYADGTVSPAMTFVSHIGGSNTFATAQPVPLDSDISGGLPTVEFGGGQTHVYVFQGTAGQTAWISGSASNGGAGSGLYMELANGSELFVDSQGLLDPSMPQDGVPKPTIFTFPRTGRYFLDLSSAVGDRTYSLQLRTYTPSVVSVARDMRDIVLVRSTDGGVTWSPKLRVNHDPPGRDQAMPNVAVDQVGHVYVAWYDRRDAAAGDSVHVYASVSSDGGLSFGPDLRLSSRPSSWVGPPDSEFGVLLPGELVGDRVAIAGGDDYGIVAWADFRNWNTRSDIYSARIMDVPTAVEAVSDLTAEPLAGGVRLSWHVNDERGISGLRLFRSDDDGPEAALGAADLSVTHEGEFEQLDGTAQLGHAYAYRLRVLRGAQASWLGPVAVTLPARITALAWRSAWPNPFALRTTVKLAVPRTAEGTVRVYDVQGKEVRTLVEGRFDPGEREIEWDGRDAGGGTAPPGLYFVAAHIGGETAKVRLARVP